MRTITTVKELRAALVPHRQQLHSIGFVPTMGALHDGHLSLVRQSKLGMDLTVVSIFVNPTQFAPNEDFTQYPRTQIEDARILVEAGVDILFQPELTEMYPTGSSTFVNVEGLTDVFEGAIRPHHYKGVTTVVASLFNQVQPTVAFFGQKDAQQVAVIKRMVRDLHFPLEIRVGETVREPDGLAMSSRNRYLNPEDRKESVALYSALKEMRDQILQGASVESSRQSALLTFSARAPNATLDYLDAVGIETFQKLTSFQAVGSILLLIAARLGATRLLDNLVVKR